MKKKKSKKNLFSGKTLFWIFVASALLLFALSFVSTRIGDILLPKDYLKQAKILYSIGKITNPFDPSIDTRLAAVQTILDERQIESEETEINENPIVFRPTENTNVLGASITVPVVMLHYVRWNPNPNDKVGFGLSVTPPDFAAQMDYLARRGYHTISLDEFGAALLYGKPLPEKPIVLTFDDGYRDFYEQAFPVLKQHGFKATNFIITNFVGLPAYLTWDQINEMKNSGLILFGSHTLYHRALTYLTNESVKKEVTESRNILQSHLGYRINWFAYPYGNVNERVATIVKQSGYVGAFGTNNGAFHSADRLFTLPRVRDGGGLGVSGFAARLPW